MFTVTFYGNSSLLWGMSQSSLRIFMHPVPDSKCLGIRHKGKICMWKSIVKSFLYAVNIQVFDYKEYSIPVKLKI